MDPTAVNQNLTVDDFDSIITYGAQSQWTTPNPQLSLPFNQSNTPWFAGTYHLTNVSGASFTFDFGGPEIFIWGAAGPEYGSYEISIDGKCHVSSAHASSNASRYLLYSNTGLTFDDHTLKVTNLGAKDGDDGANQFLFDYLETTVQLAPAGASVTNTTVQETDPNLTYTGNWTTNVYNPAFSGGGSKYTNADGASVSLSFHGSALYIFGDKTNRHGLYTATLDNGPLQQYDGVSGCGGAFAKYCEKTNTLAYFAGNLGAELHTVTVKNIAGVNDSYFDLDAIVYTTPSKYEVRQPWGVPPSTGDFDVVAYTTSSKHEVRQLSGVPHSIGGPATNMLLVLLVLSNTILLGSGRIAWYGVPVNSYFHMLEVWTKIPPLESPRPWKLKKRRFPTFSVVKYTK